MSNKEKAQTIETELISAEELAKLLGVSKPHLHKLRLDGTLGPSRPILDAL